MEMIWGEIIHTLGYTHADRCSEYKCTYVDRQTYTGAYAHRAHICRRVYILMFLDRCVHTCTWMHISVLTDRYT